MEPTRIISVIGRKNAGKTTLMVALASEFTRQGKQVGTIKHGHHPALIDTEGTDTWRHYNEGLARRSMIESPGLRVLFERTAADGEPEALARQYMGGIDIVLVEGFKQSALPKIEVHRSTLHDAPLLTSAGPAAELWVAVVTDSHTLRVECPTFRFTDTSWLVTLSSLVWSRAKFLQP